MSRRTVVAIICCAALYLLGNRSVSLWDRDEPRYAQASRQMLQSGDWVVPKLLDAPRINKPPLVYWCQAAAMRLLGDNSFAARLPSSIAMTLTLLLLALVLTRIAGEEHAFWSVLVFGTSGLVIMAAKMCLTDAVLLLFVTAAQLCLYAMCQGHATWRIVIAFAIATGLGLLTKGPVVLGVNATTVAVLALFRFIDRRSPSQAARIQWSPVIAKTLVAILIILAIALPWVLAMQRRLPGGLKAVFDHDVWERMTTPLEQHKGPPGFYLLFFFASFFPWCLMMPTALKLAWRARAEPLTRFALAALVGPWVMFECIQTKLPHYVLPCMPFLAILTAHAIVSGLRSEQDEWNRRGWQIAVGIWAAIVVLVGLAPWFATSKDFAFDRLPYGPMALVSVVAIAFAAVVFLQFARHCVNAGAYSMAGGMLLLMASLFGLYLPAARFLHLSEELGGYLQSIGADQVGEVYMIDYKEDSLPFYQGGTIRPQRDNAYLEKAPPKDWPKFLVLTREIWNAAPDAAKSQWEVLKTFHGWAYAAKGRVVDVMVIRNAAPPTAPPAPASRTPK